MARSSTRRRWSTVLAAAVVALAGLPLVGTGAAAADTAPVPPVTVPTASADSLPTVQINGIVWDQAIGPGNRVYAVGEFTQARPAGAAAGTQQTARANILAYDLTTGNLISSWNPGINGYGRDVEVSPDGTRVYVVGNFTQASGSGGQGGTNQTRNRIAAFDAATGALLSFNPGANSRVKSVEAVGSTVYFGGNFTTLGGQARARLAATSTTGALLPWNASTDREVFMIVSPPGSDVVVAGGAFANANGVGTGGGLAAFDAASGQLRSWEAYGTFPNNGVSSAIYSLSADAQQVYGTGYDYGGGSPFEGSFGIGVASGRVNWVNGCKGDTYDAVPLGGVLYSVGHPHDCAMVQGHPQSEPWTFQRAMAQTTTAGADGRVNTYQAYAGRPAPELLHWLPTLAPGSYSGSTQAAWTVDGNDDYVLLGGEFPTVNGAPQQGLARFAVNPPQHRQGPQGGAQLTPDGVSLVPGAVRVGWTAAWDRDNRRLTYEVLRGGAVVGTMQADSAWWKRDRLSFTDTGLTPGSTQSYRIRVTDAFGNTVTGNAASITVQNGAGGPMPYADAVRADGPTGYWRLGEPSGSLVYDWAGASDLTLSASAARGVPGPLTEADTATGFTGADSVPAAPPAATRTAPDTFTAEAWFRTATPGGKIIGFGDSAAGTSSNYDRHVYMTPDGRVVFGVYPGGVRTVASPARYDDDRWHHVVAALGPAGQVLYVDGVQVGVRTDTTSGQPYSGVWRIGGDNLNGWPDTGSRFSFAGAIDEVAVYPTVLTPAQVAGHHALGSGQGPANAAPTAAFTAEATALSVAFDATGSTDPDGTVASWAWDFGDGTTGTGATPVHPYAAAGSYQVGLVVTDDDGAVSAPVVRTVAVTAAPVPNQPPVASFTAAPTGLSVAFDGTGSTDADGTVASYAWDFGDGDTATGPTPGHDYDAAGTYTATLTVTDDDGATATASRSVAVTAPAAVTHAADAFGRTLGTTWGSADVGGAWTTVNTGYSVANGSGAISVAAGGTRTAYLNSVSQSALDLGVSVSLDKPQTGGGTYLSVVGRRIGADDYRVTLRYTNNGALAAQLIRVVGGTSTTLGAVTLPGGPFAAGETVRVRFQVVGTGTTTLNAKVWRAGTAEPAAWTVSRTDTAAALQGPGSIGFIHYLSGSATTTPMIARFDDLLVTAPGPA